MESEKSSKTNILRLDSSQGFAKQVSKMQAVK
jgi:hypothetical protein